MGVYHADYRKLENQYRFVQEIMEAKLVVSKKKKAVVVQELRDCKYEAFPKDNGDSKMAKSKDDEESAEEEDDAGSSSDRDFDYLLSVSLEAMTRRILVLTPLTCFLPDAHLVVYAGAPRPPKEAD